MRISVRSLATLGAGVIVVIIGVLLPEYYTSILIFMFIYAALALSYDIIGGLLGYMNLGHIIFYGVGAYMFAISLNYLYSSTHHLSFSLIFFISIFASVTAATALAALLSYPLFRLKGFYFAVATLGLISLTNVIVSSPEMSPITGGFSGINLMSDIARMSNLQNSYLYAISVLIIVISIHSIVCKGTLKTIFKCIKEDEVLSECTGINLFRYKQLSLMISAGLAALAGTVYMWFQTYTNPRLIFSIELAFLPIVIALIGGPGELLGILISSAIFTIVYQFFLINLPSLAKTIIGIILISMGLSTSAGIGGLIHNTLRVLRRTYGRFRVG